MPSYDNIDLAIRGNLMKEEQGGIDNDKCWEK
jgi:hypothetical protein